MPIRCIMPSHMLIDEEREPETQLLLPTGESVTHLADAFVLVLSHLNLSLCEQRHLWVDQRAVQGSLARQRKGLLSNPIDELHVPRFDVATGNALHLSFDLLQMSHELLDVLDEQLLVKSIAILVACKGLR